MVRLQNEKLKNVTVNLRNGRGSAHIDHDGVIEVDHPEDIEFFQSVCGFTPATAPRAPRGLMGAAAASKSGGMSEALLGKLLGKFEAMETRLAELAEENAKLKAEKAASGKKGSKKGASAAQDGSDGSDEGEGSQADSDASEGQQGAATGKGAKKGPKPE